LISSSFSSIPILQTPYSLQFDQPPHPCLLPFPSASPPVPSLPSFPNSLKPLLSSLSLPHSRCPHQEPILQIPPCSASSPQLFRRSRQTTCHSAIDTPQKSTQYRPFCSRSRLYSLNSPSAVSPVAISTHEAHPTEGLYIQSLERRLLELSTALSHRIWSERPLLIGCSVGLSLASIPCCSPVPCSTASLGIPPRCSARLNYTVYYLLINYARPAVLYNFLLLNPITEASSQMIPACSRTITPTTNDKGDSFPAKQVLVKKREVGFGRCPCYFK
jgi:hypothetical protein